MNNPEPTTPATPAEETPNQSLAKSPPRRLRQRHAPGIPKRANFKSPLQKLPKERQAEIIERLRCTSIKEMSAQLTAEGFPTGTNALGRFWTWWHKHNNKVSLLDGRAPKKPDVRSPLQTLPPDRQATLMLLIERHTFVEVRQILAKDWKITISDSAISNFRGWWYSRRVMTDSEREAKILVDKLAAFDPTLTPEELARRGNQHFNKLAILNDNDRIWANTQRVELDREKFQHEANRSNDASQSASKPRGENIFNDPAKIEAARKLVFGDAPE